MRQIRRLRATRAPVTSRIELCCLAREELTHPWPDWYWGHQNSDCPRPMSCRLSRTSLALALGTRPSTSVLPARLPGIVWPENFHEFLAIDIGGKVVYTSLVQPYQNSFSSLNGKVVISGSLGRTIATAVKDRATPTV